MGTGVCIVGCGRFATFHARAARRLGRRVRLSFASRDPARAEAYRRRFGGVRAYDSYEAAAADPEVRALLVCTPHHLHLEHVRLAARHGKAVLLEKPIARTVAEADRLLAEAAAAGILLMVGENFHFMPALRAARRLLLDGAIGPVRQVVIGARGARTPSGWRRQREAVGGGLLIDGGVHYVHLLRDWGGPVAAVQAVIPDTVVPGLEGEDTAFILLRFRSGAVGQLANSLAAPGLPRLQWAWATGPGGSLAVANQGHLLWLRNARGPRLRVFLRDRRGLGAQLAEFLDALGAGRPPALPAASTREDVAVVAAAYEAAATGRTVTLVDSSPGAGRERLS
jgi:predicted dehydrogenase